MITDREANALCSLIQKGSGEAADRLLKACEPYMQTLVVQNLWKFPLPSPHLLQEARKAFWEASKTFSPSKGRFLPYAAKKASWAFQTAYREDTQSIHIPETTLRAKGESKSRDWANIVRSSPMSGIDEDIFLGERTPSVLDQIVHEEHLAQVWDALPEDPDSRERIIRKYGLRNGVEVPYAELASTRQYAHKEIGYTLRAMKVTLRSHTFKQKTKRRPNAEL